MLSRDEVYCAKLLIDTVVQRAGDALAAAAFQLLGEIVCAVADMTTLNPNPP